MCGLFVVAACLDWYFLPLQTLDEMHLTERIRTVNCVYDPYKPYGSTNRCDPFAWITRDLYYCPTNEVQFSDCIRTETVFYDLPNGTDRKFVVSNRISLCILDMTEYNRWQPRNWKTAQIASDLENNHIGRKLSTIAISLDFLIEIFFSYNYLLKLLIGIPIQILIFLSAMLTLSLGCLWIYRPDGVGAQILRVFWQPMNNRFMGMKIGPISKNRLHCSRFGPTLRETDKSDRHWEKPPC